MRTSALSSKASRRCSFPNFGNGILSLPGAYSTTTISPTAFNRGYIQSWNITVQKELR